MRLRTTALLLASLASPMGLADVTPLDNNELEEQAIAGSVISEDAQTIEELEALQDQQRMLPGGDTRIEPSLVQPQQGPPPGQQQFLNSIIDAIDTMQAPPPPAGL